MRESAAGNVLSLASVDSDTIKRLLVGNIEYVLLIVSMTMTRMVWLRIIAIGSGISGLVYSTFWLHDPVGIFWETAFTVVNIVQLLLIKYRNAFSRFNEDDMDFYQHVVPELELYQVRRLLGTGKWLKRDSGTELTRQGEVVSHLLYIKSGVADVVVDGKPVGSCAAHSLIGEISISTGQPASATVIVKEPIRYLALERQALQKVMRSDPDILLAVERSLRRNLESTLILRTKPATSKI